MSVEVEHVFQSVECARNKLLSRTVLQSLRFFLWITYGWVTCSFHSKTKIQHVKTRKKIEQLNDVDCVPTNTPSSQGESQLYIFEDTEAVIKMIIRRRSPTMRRVQNPQSCS